MSNASTRVNRIFRWLGTVSYAVGMVLTSFNVYPLNLPFMLVGASLWTIAAVGVADTPLYVIEGAAILSYGSGLVYVLYR